MKIVSINEHMELSEAEARNRRRAIQIVAQLPENAREALAVLGLCEELVRSFLSAGGL